MAKDCTKELLLALDSYRQQWLFCVKTTAATWEDCTIAYWELAAEAWAGYLLCLGKYNQNGTLSPEQNCYLRLMYALWRIHKKGEECLETNQLPPDECYKVVRDLMKLAWEAFYDCIRRTGKPKPKINPKVEQNPYNYPPMTGPDDANTNPIITGIPRLAFPYVPILPSPAVPAVPVAPGEPIIIPIEGSPSMAAGVPVPSPKGLAGTGMNLLNGLYIFHDIINIAGQMGTGKTLEQATDAYIEEIPQVLPGLPNPFYKPRGPTGVPKGPEA